MDKARPLLATCLRVSLLETLRPFVYRRYLDYTALEAARMKHDRCRLANAKWPATSSWVQADTRNRVPGAGAAADRGGREPALRQRSLLPALSGAALGRPYACCHGEGAR